MASQVARIDVAAPTLAGSRKTRRPWSRRKCAWRPRDRAATATWDGAFALACETDESQFRIYKGDVLEAGSRVPNGPAFTLAADALAWTELFTAGSDDFIRRAMQGEFSVRGSADEYLRTIGGVLAFVEERCRNTGADQSQPLFTSSLKWGWG